MSSILIQFITFVSKQRVTTKEDITITIRFLKSSSYRWISFEIVLQRFCTKFAPNGGAQTKRKPRNHCGFWVFEVLDEK